MHANVSNLPPLVAQEKGIIEGYCRLSYFERERFRRDSKRFERLRQAVTYFAREGGMRFMEHHSWFHLPDLGKLLYLFRLDPESVARDKRDAERARHAMSR